MSNLCAKCIGEQQFSDWIIENGTVGLCDFNSAHGGGNKVVPIEEFAEVVDEYFRKNYQLGEEERYVEGESDSVGYEQRGEPYTDILANDLRCDENVIDGIGCNLPDCSDRDIAKGAEPFYDDLAHYEPIESVRKREQAEEEERWYEERFRHQWNEFRVQVQYHRRFFRVKELLDDLFGSINEYEKGTIKPLYNLTVGTILYRARQIDNGFTSETLRADPIKELGAPPRDRALAGRMNVEFIPAFYAAFSEYTAIAEIRPSIGDEVAVAKFIVEK
jgi:RES domain